MRADNRMNAFENPKPRLQDDARLAAMVASLGEAYYVLDREWRVALLNDEAAHEYFERPRDEVIGRSLWELFPGAERSPFTALLRTAMDDGVAGRLRRPSENRPGHYQEYRVAPLGDEGLGVYVIDVTERVLAEAELRANRERLDLAVGAHGIGIFDWDRIADTVNWSAEMEAIFGLPPGAFEGHIADFRRRVWPDDLARMDVEVAAALAAGQDLVSYQFRVLRDDGSAGWVEGAARLVFVDGVAVRMVGANVDITARKAAEHHQHMLFNELNHRVKNTLAIVQSIAWQSLRSGGVSRQVRDTFEGRLTALATAHDVLTRRDWEAGSIGQILANAVAPHDPGDGRLNARGPTVDLEPKTAVALALAMHELATNAVKYGAFSTSSGRVDVSWTTAGGRLDLTWRESGGPRVEGPVRRGFGARLLEQGLAAELRGPVRLDFHPEGLVCAIRAQLD
jgi:PAS domain S-box-containing protein